MPVYIAVLLVAIWQLDLSSYTCLYCLGGISDFVLSLFLLILQHLCIVTNTFPLYFSSIFIFLRLFLNSPFRVLLTKRSELNGTL